MLLTVLLCASSTSNRNGLTYLFSFSQAEITYLFHVPTLPLQIPSFPSRGLVVGLMGEVHHPMAKPAPHPLIASLCARVPATTTPLFPLSSS